MDELTLLREFERDVPPPGPHASFVARTRLGYAIEEEMTGGRGSRRAPAVAVAAVAAAAIAVAVAARNPAEPPEPPVQLTSAAGTLQIAARAAAQDRVAAPRDGQFAYIKEIVTEVPVAGGATERFVDESWLAVSDEPSLVSERGRRWWASANWLPRTYEELRELPTDPAQLLLMARSWPRDGRSDPDPMSAEDYDTAFFFLAGLLRSAPVMPPQLRGAAFGALARIPGVEVAEERLGPRGPHVLAIRRPRSRLADQSYLVARGTYEYLGQRDEYVNNDGVLVRQTVRVVDRGLVDRVGQRPAG